MVFRAEIGLDALAVFEEDFPYSEKPCVKPSTCFKRSCTGRSRTSYGSSE